MRGVLVANSTSSLPGPLNEWRRKAKLSIQLNDSRHARSCNDCPNKPEENQTKYTTTEKTSRAVNANIDSDASSILLNHEHFGTQFYSCHEVNTLFVLFVTLFSPSFFFHGILTQHRCYWGRRTERRRQRVGDNWEGQKVRTWFQDMETRTGDRSYLERFKEVGVLMVAIKNRSFRA